jgi:hypothetical protein
LKSPAIRLDVLAGSVIVLGSRIYRHYIEDVKLKSKYWIAASFLAFALSCSSDPEGPVSEKFVDDGTYGIKGGEIRRVILPLSAVTVSVPEGVGTGPLLILGRIRGIEYRAVLLKFNFTLKDADVGKTISSARLHLAMQVSTPADLKLPATFHELLSSFSDTSSVTAVPPYDSDPILDSLGKADDTLNIERTEYDIDTAVVNGWLSGTREHKGIAIVWDPAAVTDTTITIEMKAREYGGDPPAVRVTFTDGSSAVFGAVADYSVAVFDQPGLNCVGVIAKRVAFTFDPDSLGIPERAMVNASFLVLKVRGDQGFGGTVGEQLVIGYSPVFNYYLYTPDSADPLSAGFREGTGVDQSELDATVSKRIRMPLRGFMRDILRGARVNTGLVLQSNLESTRIQRVSFVSGVAGVDADAPYIEIIYSLPADFGGTR